MGRAVTDVVSIRAGHRQVVWPSGPRRTLQARVRKGVGSNPTATIFVFFVNSVILQPMDTGAVHFSEPKPQLRFDCS